jgi:hypothetical protein
MARVNLFGQEFRAEPIECRQDGSWKMRALEHTPRTFPGTIIEVRQSEIIEMAAAEAPDVSREKGLAELEAAMAEERKTLPTYAELVAKARKDGTIPRPKPPDDPE